MNNDILELWGRWALATAKGQQQVNVMGDWMQNGMQVLENFSSGLLQLWGAGRQSPGAGQRSTQPSQTEEGWHAPWDMFLQMQEHFWGFQSSSQIQELTKKVAQLEQMVTSQGRALELLKSRLDYESPEQTTQFASQFRELIESQNQQFKQLTSSFTDYFKDIRKNSGNRNE